jgi:MFS family permease
MSRPLRWYDYFTVNIYFTGLTTVGQTLTPLVVPLLVQLFVGSAQQGSFYGTIRLWSLMVAVLVQALSGMLSDRSTLRWGRRRPFILVGTLLNVVFITSIGLTTGLSGMRGYWALFVLLILVQIAANIAHGAAQGLIPDIVPEKLRGRYSGVKAILEIPIPVILVSLIIGRLIATGNLWAALIAVIVILTITMLIALFAPEKPLEIHPPVLDWQPFLRLVLMTAVFTLIILGSGQAIKAITSLVRIQSSLSIWLIALLGLATMALAIVAGVWLSVLVGVGPAARQNTSYTWWVINRLAFMLGSINLASFTVYFLQGRLGLERELAAAPASRLIMVVGVFILLMGLPSGWLSDRFGSRLMVLISGLVAATGSLVIILSSTLPTIYVGAVLVGAAAGIFYTANWALGTRLVPPSEAGRYLGISNLAGAGAGAVGAYIGGPIADAFTRALPQSPGLGYVVLFAIFGCLFLFSSYAASRISPPPADLPSSSPQPTA